MPTTTLQPHATQTAQTANCPRVYHGDGDDLMRKELIDADDQRIVLIPDALPSRKPDARPHLRIMWGQHLLEDLLAGRYRSVVCAVNAQDNSHGIIAQLAAMLPTSQWDERSITTHAQQFATTGGESRVKVLKFDMDMVEVLAVLRPPSRKHFTLADLASAFRIVTSMIHNRPERWPSASVSFLGARANALLDDRSREPAFETILKTMFDSGYTGDVYPSPQMWQLPPIGLYTRYPFPAALDRMREGGY
jgi:hypothetical protein